MSYVNLKSTANLQGESVTQIIHFNDGTKRTFSGILTGTIKQGQFTKMMRTDGSLLMIHDVNVLCIEIYPEKKEE